MTDADPALAALLLAAADPPLGEGDGWLEGTRLVLADWLGERGDGRAEAVRNCSLATLVAANAASGGESTLCMAGLPGERFGLGGSSHAVWRATEAAARRGLRRRLLGLFPGVFVEAALTVSRNVAHEAAVNPRTKAFVKESLRRRFGPFRPPTRWPEGCVREDENGNVVYSLAVPAPDLIAPGAQT